MRKITTDGENLSLGDVDDKIDFIRLLLSNFPLILVVIFSNFFLKKQIIYAKDYD